LPLPLDRSGNARGPSMKPFVWAAAVTLALASLDPAPAGAQSAPAELRNLDIDIAYVEPKDEGFRPIYRRLKDRRVLEQLQQFLAPLRLPAKINVSMDQCGRPFALRRPGGPVMICYEYIDQIERLAPGGAVFLGSTWITTRDDALVGAV